MSKDQAENLLLLTATVAQYNLAVKPLTVAVNLAKLQRLSVSLGKHYGDTVPDLEIVNRHERKARELGIELGLLIEHRRDRPREALGFMLGGREFSVF